MTMNTLHQQRITEQIPIRATPDSTYVCEKRTTAGGSLSSSHGQRLEHDQCRTFQNRLKEADNEELQQSGLHEIHLNKYVQTFNDKTFQKRLQRLYDDLGRKNPEAWAMELYLNYRMDRSNAHARQLDEDHQVCLSLLLEMVEEWKWKHGFSQEFAEAIQRDFQVERIVRILNVCLVMNRARALYYQRTEDSASSAYDHDDFSIIGMHWYCKLHFFHENGQGKLEEVSDEDGSSSGSGDSDSGNFRLESCDSICQEDNGDFKNTFIQDSSIVCQKDYQLWTNQLLHQYKGYPTMDERLFHLLFNIKLTKEENKHSCLSQTNENLVRWSRPQAATIVKQRHSKSLPRQ